MVITLGLRSESLKPQQPSLEDLEAKADYFVQRLLRVKEADGIQAYFVGEDPKLVGEGGSVVFSSSAFRTYLDEVGDTALSRSAFRRVMERPSQLHRGYTIFYDAIHRLMELYATKLSDTSTTHHNRTLRREVSGIMNGPATMLYAAIPSPLTVEGLAATSRTYVKLRT